MYLTQVAVALMCKYKFPTDEERKTLETLSGLCIVTGQHFKLNVITHATVIRGGIEESYFYVAIKLKSHCSHPERRGFVSTSPCLLEVFLPSVPILRPHTGPELHLGSGR